MPRSVAAVINYLAQTSIRPEVWNEDFSRNILPLEAVEVRIEDAAFRDRAPSLDVEGFALVPHKTSVEDLAGGGSSAETYTHELHVLLSGLIGADHITMANASPVRRSKPAPTADLNNGFPVPFVHCDCSDAGVLPMVEWAYGPAPARPVRRMALYNFWRLLSPGPTDLPLAVCDARTLTRADIVPGSSHFLTSNFTTEAVFVRPNRDHRWSYFSRMTLDDVLIFKQFDSERTQPSQVPHTAFEDSSCPAGAAPRVSIESRAVAYWFAD